VYEGNINFNYLKMNYQIKQRNGILFMLAPEGELLISNEQDAVDLIALCYEENTDRLILFADNLKQEFFDLKTKLAGAIFQKFSNYRVKCALVISTRLDKDRFHEMLIEVNRQQSIHFFHKLEEAEEWILN
jgi:PadR family transcriptional regulator, regulatory protein AphA